MTTAAAQQHSDPGAFEWRAVLRELQRRNPVLATTGWIHLALAIVMLGILPFDTRLVTGVNPWIKPVKFAISIAIYAWTLAWLMEYLSRPRWTTLVSRGIALSMYAEMACIALQAARGTTSHFNQSTVFDGVVFGVMGVMIALNTVLVVLVLIAFFRGRIEIPAAYLWGIRAGLIVFLLASGIGGVMIGNNGHTVGVADGGPGLPFVNWSTAGGDLRIAHFLGLHALQLLPILGFLIGRRALPSHPRIGYVLLASAAYTCVVAILFLQAMRGTPLLKL